MLVKEYTNPTPIYNKNKHSWWKIKQICKQVFFPIWIFSKTTIYHNQRVSITHWVAAVASLHLSVVSRYPMELWCLLAGSVYHSLVCVDRDKQQRRLCRHGNVFEPLWRFSSYLHISFLSSLQLPRELLLQVFVRFPVDHRELEI